MSLREAPSGEATGPEFGDLRAMGWRFIALDSFDHKITVVKPEQLVIFDRILFARIVVDQV